MSALDQVEHAMLAGHHVEVDFARQVFVKLQRVVVERCAFGIKIIGTDDRGVTTGIAAADPAALDDL